MLDCDSEKSLTELEKKIMLSVWWGWKGVVFFELLPMNQTIRMSTAVCESYYKQFFGNTKSRNHKHLIDNMLQNFQEMKVKIHMMHSHLDFFPENMGAVSDEHGE